MSVFTELKTRDVEAIVADYALGDLLDYQGISGGTDNTNYFLETTRGSYVLTVLERTDDAAGDFAGALAQHLLDLGIPCAPPVPRRDGNAFSRIRGKRTVLAPLLPGASVLDPTTHECAQVGEMLGRLHIATRSFTRTRVDPYGIEWLSNTRQQLASALTPSQQLLFDVQWRELSQLAKLPADQVVHGDLFRDNVLFNNNHISGIIDLYFACNASWLLDLAITVNDWCWHKDALDREQVTALCGAYRTQRRFDEFEQQHWPLLLRYAALRFWASRLLDQNFPRSGQQVVSKAAEEMEHLLRYHRRVSAPPLP